MSTGYIKDGAYIETAGLGYGGGWCGMPDWGYAQKVTFDGNWQYTAPDDGYIFGRAYSKGDGVSCDIMISGIIVATALHVSAEYISWANVSVPINKGDVLSASGNTLDSYALAFVPFKAASAGEGLSAAAVKQLRRLNYYSGLKDATSLIKADFDAKFGAYYKLDSFRYIRAGHTVQFWLRAEIVAVQEGSGIKLDGFCDATGVPKPAIYTFVEGYFGGARVALDTDGSLLLTREGSGLGNIAPGWHNNFAFTYITDDPIPGEEA